MAVFDGRVGRVSHVAWMAVLTATCAVALGGCGSSETERNSVAIAETTQALTPGNYSYSDASGQVEIQVKVCPVTPAGVGLRCGFCAVDPKYLLIGGGAEIVGSPSSARLQASRPDAAGTGIEQNCPGNSQSGDVWLVRSYGQSSHSLQVYAIGLSMNGTSATDLQLYVQTFENTTGFLRTPTMVLDPPSGFDLIGGGAELLSGNPNPPTGYLTESRPDNPGVNNSWRASGFFNSGTTGSVKAFAIGIKRCPPIAGWSNCIATKWRSATSSFGSGYRSVNLTTPYPWASVSVGANAVTSGGRYLADLIPLSGTGQGFSVSSKDEGATVSGSVTGYSMGIAKGGPDPWWFNVIRFVNSPTVFSRPTGTAPVNLQQSTDSANVAVRHWYLESIGSGLYLIHNGNPNQGNECAARQAGSPGNVKVLPCDGFNSDFYFTIEGGDISSSFRLRNLANGRCIDNGGSSSTSDLLFRTCPSSTTPGTQVYLTTNAWPQ